MEGSEHLSHYALTQPKDTAKLQQNSYMCKSLQDLQKFVFVIYFFVQLRGEKISNSHEILGLYQKTILQMLAEHCC